MNKFYLLILFASLFVTSFSQSKYFSPKPSWVKKIDLPNSSLDTRSISNGYYYFLNDYQIKAAENHFYFHYAYKIINSGGLEAASTLNFDYNPSFEKLKVHGVKIIRGNEVIDCTSELNFKILQRANGLESNVYNENLTLTCFLEDVRVNDIVEYEYSLIGANPIFFNKFYFSFYTNSTYQIKETYCRIIKPNTREFFFNYLNETIKPVKHMEGDDEIFEWTIIDALPYNIEPGCPNNYDPFNLIEITEYNSWTDVSDWASEVFDMSFVPSNELKKKAAEFKSIKNKSDQLMAAVHFVQNEIRYFGVEIGINSHKPRNPNEVFKTRYGDCKDKVQLLRYFLSELEMYSCPVLVHSVNRNRLGDRTPSPHQFDHVILEVTPQKFNYYFDPTISYQEGNIQNYYTPNYECGLRAVKGESNLVYFTYTRNFDAQIKEHFVVKSMKGDAYLEVKTINHGYKADENRSLFANSNNFELADNYKSFYKNIYGALESIGELKTSDGKTNNVFTVIEKYNISKIWNDTTTNPGIMQVYFPAHFLSQELNSIDLSLDKRNDPLYIPHPINLKQTIEIDLPDDWSIEGDVLNIQSIYFVYQRQVSYIKTQRKLILEYSFKSRGKEVSSGEYVKFKEDLQKVINDLNYSVYYNRDIMNELSFSSINWMILFVQLLTAIICLWILKRIYANSFKKDVGVEVPKKLGGMLIVPYLLIPAHFLYVVFELVGGYYYNREVWLVSTDVKSINYISGFAPLITTEVVFYTFIIFLEGFALLLFVKNSHKFPPTMVVMLIVIMCFSIIDPVFKYIVLREVISSKQILGLLFFFGVSGVFISYILTSERSKETFIL